jgi:hypothetical protein
MRRRSSGLASLFDRMLENNLGRLRTLSNMWAVIGSRWDKKRLDDAFGRFQKEDRVLVKRKCVRCPKPPADDFVKTDNHWWVPWTECVKCPLHIKSGRIRFPRCGYMFEDEAQALLKTESEINGVVDKATAMINEWMK